ncbi:MAG: carbohydrate kinase [Rhodospirillaceae bacterium]|nr:carbohydrate kinase [Rhodospirillaceae bacterium]
MILCCGEALIDMIPAPTTTGREGYVPHCGGAVFNTAIALGRLGVPAGLLTGLSRDLFGRQLAAELRASGVDTGYVVTSDRPTTLAFVDVRAGQATYTFYDENSAGRMLQAGDLPAVPGGVTALYMGGISLAWEPAADAYAALLDREGRGRVVMLDPNIRHQFIKDVARYRARLGRMIGQADIVKVSDEDLDWIFPDAPSPAAKIDRMKQLGPAVVIVTYGRQGSKAFLRSGEAAFAKAETVEVVDTVGAGDTFNAGVLAKLHRLGAMSKEALASISTGTLQQALAFGARVAAVTVSRAGADPPWANEV